MPGPFAQRRFHREYQGVAGSGKTVRLEDDRLVSGSDNAVL